jgi:antitoxin component of MazEF toxin-antitoxin module
MAQKVIKTGNSLAVTIPSDFVKSAGIRAGDEVKLLVKIDQGQLIYNFSGAKQLSLLRLKCQKA